MSKLSAKDYKAIEWYMREKQLKPKLSTPPTMYFTSKLTGEEVTEQLSSIVNDYNHWNAEDQKERARQRKVAETKKIIKRAW